MAENLTNNNTIEICRANTHLSSELLSMAMLNLRQNRESSKPDQTYYVRYDKAYGRNFAQLWFLSRGCSWDKRGECTMCNYGVSSDCDASKIASYVESGLASIDRPLDELYVSPSGSLFDENEVPKDARHQVLKMVNDFPCENFSFETRPSTITDEAVKELHTLLPDKEVAVGFGVESANQFVLEHCVNKPEAFNSFKEAMKSLDGIGVYANISLGTAFLTANEAIEDTLQTVRSTLDSGAERAIVFPMHTKQHTLLNWLNKKGFYETPSLWSLIEVINRLAETEVPKVTISWYRPDYGNNPDIISSPTTCPDCRDNVLRELDNFRENPTVESVQNLRYLDCHCRQDWISSLEEPSPPLNDRLYAIYGLLADDLGFKAWWSENSIDIGQEIGI